jgi:divalent metal cation (Fe/Co/Zn/Cd) transporter
VLVAIEVKAMLIGQGMDPERQAQLRGFLEARPEIDSLVSLITLQLGNRVMVSVQARMHEQTDARALVSQVNTVERALKREFPEVMWSFFEPELGDVADPA